MKASTNSKLWHARLFHQPLPTPEVALNAERSEITEKLKNEMHSFLDAFVPNDAISQKAELDHWYSSSAGQSELVRLVDFIWSEMTLWSEHAMPAHDARHAIYKVPSDAVEHLHAEGVQGWERVGLIGALLHDYGRWAEERVFGGPCKSSNHSRMSFVLAREIFENFNLPAPVRDHILNAVGGHTAGADANDPMVYKIVVAADRNQLYGPEIILRLFHHSINTVTGAHSKIYGPSGSPTVLGVLHSYIELHKVGPLFARMSHFVQMWKTTYLFALMCDDSSSERVRWQLALNKNKNMPLVQGIEFDQYLAAAHSNAIHGACANEMALAFLDSPHLAKNPIYKHAAMEKLKTIPDHLIGKFGSAMGFMHRQLINQNKRQFNELERIRRSYESKDDFVCRIIDLIKIPC